MSGSGIFFWPNGDSLNASFEKDAPIGMGVYCWSDGCLFEGFFFGWKVPLSGQLKVNGVTYEGNINNSKFTGKELVGFFKKRISILLELQDMS